MKGKLILFLSFLSLCSFHIFAEDSLLQKKDSELHKRIENPNNNDHLSKYIEELKDIRPGNIRNSFPQLKVINDKEGMKKKAKDFLNSLDNHGKTPLMYAIECNDIDAVELFLDADANTNISAKDDKTALLLAIENAKTVALKNQNEKDKAKRIINALLDKGVNTNKPFISANENYTPLLLACTIDSGKDYEYKKEILEKIISNSSKTDELGNIYNGKLFTPLSYLCYSKNSAEYITIIEQLLEKGCDTNKIITIDGFKGTISQYLCAEYSSENLQIIELLIKYGADIDSSFSYRNQTLTPLICAVRSKDKNFIDIISTKITKLDNAKKSYSIKYEGKDWTGSAIHLVARQGDKVLYNIFKDKGYINTAKDSEGKTAIDYLKESCKNKVDELFLLYEIAKDNGKTIEAAINAIDDLIKDRTSDKNQQTALQVIISNHDDENAIKLLKQFKEKNKLNDLWTQEDSSESEPKNAFDYAIINNDQSVIKWFIDEHVAVSKSIFTIIDKILDDNDAELIDTLESFLRIESKPNATLFKRFIYTPESGFIVVNPIVYTAMRVSDSSKKEQQIKIIEKLLENNININDCAKNSSEEGNSALVYAIKNDNTDLAEYLINKGINLELVSKPTTESADFGKTVLFYALERKNNDIVKLILKKNELILKDIKLPETGETLLMFFAKYSPSDVLKSLLPYYLQENKNCMVEKDKTGMTPFLWAIKENETMEIAKLLRIYGADVTARNNLKENAIKIAKEGKGNIDEKIKRLESWGVENDR